MSEGETPKRRLKPVRWLYAIAAGLAVALCGAAAGAWLAWERITDEQANARIERVSGPWRWNANDQMFSDPLSIARTAHFGPFPMRSDEVGYYVALADSSGERLSGDHRYRLTGPLPRARFWSLAAYDEAGYLFENPQAKYSVSSETLSAAAGRDNAATQAFRAGAFNLLVGGAGGAPGTLPTGSGPMFLILRVYQPEDPLFPGSDSAFPVAITRISET